METQSMATLELIQKQRLGALSEFRLPVEGGAPSKEVSAFLYEPVNYNRDPPALVVLHGVTRAAGLYLSSWMPYAEACSSLLIVPRFAKTYWPGARSYNPGNMFAKDGTLVPEKDWSFTALEQLCDAVFLEQNHRNSQFAMYGHSAGAQFVHRYLIFKGGHRIHSAVVANAGWYTVPDCHHAMPYGIADVAPQGTKLESAFAAPLTIVLGKHDIRTQDPELRQTKEALSQGAHRLARGRYFYSAAKEEAARLCLSFRWSVVEIEGCGHSDKSVARVSARCLVGSEATNFALAA